MRTLILLFTALIACGFYASAAAPEKIVTGNITGAVTWSYDTIYKISGKVYLKSGATLTILPGTIIKGDYTVAGSALIVARGAKIYAIGEVNRPIVFTSSQTPGNRATADWGGIVIAGNATVNVPGGVGTFEGGNLSNPDGAVSDGQYGGLNDLDNSGELRYVRIEFAGFPYAPNNELNGLTMGGVGSGTKISYIQVSYGFDDSYEWFGGTVNADHLISYRTNDDDFDTDFGFRGRVQFGVAMRDTAVADAVSGANGFESDNDATGTANGPQTAAVFSNMTFVGPYHTPTTTINANFKRSAHIRRNSRQSVFNSIIMGWPTGVQIDGDSCQRNADSLWLQFQNNVIAGCVKNLDSTATTTAWPISNWYNSPTNYNAILPATSDVMLTAPFNYATPDFRPTAASPMLTGAAFTNTKLSAVYFDQSPAYRGAFGTTDWTQGWASFTPETNPYTDGMGPLAIINQDRNISSLNVYPNPASDVATLSINLVENAQVTCSVTDLNGRQMWSTSGSLAAGQHNFEINTNNFTSGLYFLKVQAGTSFKTVKLNILR